MAKHVGYCFNGAPTVAPQRLAAAIVTVKRGQRVFNGRERHVKRRLQSGDRRRVKVFYTRCQAMGRLLSGFQEPLRSSGTRQKAVGPRVARSLGLRTSAVGGSFVTERERSLHSATPQASDPVDGQQQPSRHRSFCVDVHSSPWPFCYPESWALLIFNNKRTSVCPLQDTPEAPLSTVE